MREWTARDLVATSAGVLARVAETVRVSSSTRRAASSVNEASHDPVVAVKSRNAFAAARARGYKQTSRHPVGIEDRANEIRPEIGRAGEQLRRRPNVRRRGLAVGNDHAALLEVFLPGAC